MRAVRCSRSRRAKAQVWWVPGPWPGRLGIVPRPRGGEWLADEVRGWRDTGVDVVVSLLTPDESEEFELQDEAAKSREAGLEFHALPIPDRDVPRSQTGAAELIHDLEQALESGKNVAVHCRQGIGRSALALASLLVASGAEPDEAFRAIQTVRGLPVPETDAQRRWVEEFALKAAAAANRRQR